MSWWTETRDSFVQSTGLSEGVNVSASDVGAFAGGLAANAAQNVVNSTINDKPPQNQGSQAAQVKNVIASAATQVSKIGTVPLLLIAGVLGFFLIKKRR